MSKLNIITINILIVVLIVFGIVCIYSIIDKKNLKDSKEKNNETEEIVEYEPIDDQIDDVDDKTTIEKYFDNEIKKDEELLKEDTPKAKNKLKESFITLTDFIFYNGKINNTSYSELKSITQHKLLTKWYQLDSKIESKYPNYKDNISTTSKHSYSNIKSKANELKTLLEDVYIEKYGKENLNRKKETIEEVEQKVKEKQNEVKDKLKSWYEELKEVD